MRELIQDERTTAQKRKIASETCSLLLLALMIAILVQQYVLNVPFANYAAEFICFFGASCYLLIRNITSGIDLYSQKNRGFKWVIISSLVCGLTICVVTGIANYTRYGDNAAPYIWLITFAITFLCGTAAAFLGFSIIHYLNNKRQKDIEAELDEEEDKL
jgi:purine-cytosine permease-like protein